MGQRLNRVALLIAALTSLSWSSSCLLRRICPPSCNCIPKQWQKPWGLAGVMMPEAMTARRTEASRRNRGVRMGASLRRITVPARMPHALLGCQTLSLGALDVLVLVENQG